MNRVYDAVKAAESELEGTHYQVSELTAGDAIANQVETLQRLLTTAKIDFCTPPPPPNFLLTFCGAGAMSAGGLSTVLGKKKARKTFLLAIICAGYLSKNEVCGFEGTNNARGQIFWFDTEQSSYHTHKSVRNVLRIANLPVTTDRLHAYKLREYPADLRFDLVQFALRTQARAGDLAILDGVVDLGLDPVLNREDAVKIVTTLINLCETLHIHICVVLHQNGKSEHSRGHIGTELENKSEIVFLVERENSKLDTPSDVSVVAARNPVDGKISFIINSEGLPQLSDTPNNTDNYSLYAFADAIKSIMQRFGDEIEAGRLRALYADYKAANRGQNLPGRKDMYNEAIAKLLQEGVIQDNGKATRGRAFKWCKDLPVFASNNLNN